ncbi:MAG: YicC/YloC family endoribonuclease, partial [Thermodesulfobacteriota bacterium]|nr:YicC/YloC family endoribonuclease [Thermodesulfobacteriota bacterium]
YNSRYLDVVLNIPRRYLSLEDKIKSIVSGRLERGRVEIKLYIVDDSEEAVAFEVNNNRATAYYNALMQLKDGLNIDSQVSLDLLAGIGGVIKPVENVRNMEDCWPVIKDCISEAMGDVVAMRKKEGDFIGGDIIKRLDYIERTVDKIDKESSGLLSLYQERLKDRISVLTKGMVDIDPERITQEAAFLADRSDISEEIVRVASHIKQFLTIMDAEEPAGRKLNFLLQELNREINTIGSKAGKAKLSYMVVDIKSELEKIREQLQNVE